MYIYFLYALSHIHVKIYCSFKNNSCNFIQIIEKNGVFLRKSIFLNIVLITTVQYQLLISFSYGLQ